MLDDIQFQDFVDLCLHLLHLRVACFPIAGAAEPGELWQYLYRIGSAELLANCATVTSHPQ